MALRPGFLRLAVILPSVVLAVGPASSEAEVPSATANISVPARGLPDRIVLSPGADAAHEMAVAFRTDAAQANAEAQLAPNIDGPGVQRQAKLVTGKSAALAGGAVYHHVVFSGLAPDSAYVYRVKGAAGWSEWFAFRTAGEKAMPFRFLYFGDIQTDILSQSSRVLRQAFHATASPALVLYAGDIITSQKSEESADADWSEWNAAGGYNLATVPQLPAAGNHEYLDVPLANGAEGRKLGPNWAAGFALPRNGTEPVKSTTYYVDYQNVRFVVLDGTAALDLGALKAETDWLEQVLAQTKSAWKVVMFHQPVFSCARSTDAESLKAAWKPLFEKYDVDLVLQGHDHCYSRLSGPEGKPAATGTKELRGPAYVVSVAGTKMYKLNDRAETRSDRVAEDTELYQVIDVEDLRLRVRVYTAVGRLYDGFDVVRAAGGKKRLVEVETALPPPRLCTAGKNGDGLPCTSRSK